MTEKKPTLCVVAGPNGSGKTPTTVQLLNNEWTTDSLYINPDNIAQEMFGDWNSPSKQMAKKKQKKQQGQQFLSPEQYIKQKARTLEIGTCYDEAHNWIYGATRCA